MASIVSKIVVILVNRVKWQVTLEVRFGPYKLLMAKRIIEIESTCSADIIWHETCSGYVYFLSFRSLDVRYN